MSDNLFNYTFKINTESQFQQTLEAVKKNRIVLPIPQSHFFTDLNNLSQESEAFGPVGQTYEEREKKFRITSKFNLGIGTKDAYATVNGLMFICRHGNSTDKVNVFLKPSTGDICDIGVKIKYFVYRGISSENFFQGLTTQTKLIHSSSTNATNFIKKVWDEFLEFNFPDNQNSNDVPFLAKQLGFTLENDPNSKLGYKFKNNPNDTAVSRNLGLIKRGEKIGTFRDTIGFEVVLDYGDSELEKTETGFQLDLDYATAKECVFNLHTNGANRNENGISGNIPLGSNNNLIVSEKIFRENIFHFMDPAAFYGAHITGTDGDNNKGKIFYGPLADTKYSTKQDIYNNVLNKFLNKNKIYLYILSKRGRSLNFYNAVTAPISINNQPQSYTTNDWPLKILDTGSTSISLQFNGSSTNASDDLLFSKDTNTLVYWNGLENKKPVLNKHFEFKKPSLNNQFLSNYIFLNFAGEINNLYHLENLGPIKLEPIFETNDNNPLLNNAASCQWVSYLKPKLMTINNEAFLFETKVFFYGYQNSPAVDPLVYRTRLYLFYPSEISQEYTNSNMDLKTTVYTSGYGLFQDSTDKRESPLESAGNYNFGRLVFNDSDISIWKGKVKDGASDISVLSLRHIKGEDLPKYHYQIGVTYNDIIAIQEGLPITNYNQFFKLEEIIPIAGSDKNFKKYRLGIRYDDLNGNPHTRFPTTDIYVYTIDGRFFSTVEYADQTIYHKVMANTTFEFLPKDNWNGEFGFDWMRKTSNSNAAFPSYDTIVGTNPTQTDGNNASTLPFDFDFVMYHSLKVNAYNSVPINWRLSSIPNNSNYPNGKDTDGEYFTSYLSLQKNKTATLKVRVKVKVEPSSLFFRYHSANFEISCKKNQNDDCGAHKSVEFTDHDNIKYDKKYVFYPFVTSQEDHFREDIEFTITCKEILKEDTRIDIVSKEQITVNNKITDVYRLAGRLVAVANEPITQEILFVPTILLLPNQTVPKRFTPFELKNQKPFLREFLGQSCINANIKVLESSVSGIPNIKSIDGVQDSDLFYLDLSSDKHFHQTYNDSTDPSLQRGHYIHTSINQTTGVTTYTIRASYSNPTGLSQIDFNNLLPKGYIPIKEYLLSKLNGLTIPRNTMVVFFINNNARSQILPLIGTGPDSSPLSDSDLGGFSSGHLTDVIIFDLSNNSTVSHEVYHSLGLPHTFNKLSHDANYNFQARKTDSIMDYSHLEGETTRSTFKWHWQIARENARKFNQR